MPLFSPYRNDRSGVSADEALVYHTHGLLYPFQSQEWNPTLDTPIPSQKVRNYCRGQISTSPSTDFRAYILAQPTIASDGVPVQAGPTNAVAGANLGGTRQDFTGNSPHTVTSFTSNFYSRILSCSLRVRNITPIDQRGGSMYFCRSPIDNTLTGSMDTQISQLEPIGYAREGSMMKDEWQYFNWIPRDPDQTEFRGNDRPPNFLNSGNVGTMLGVYMFAPNGTATQTVEFEYVCWGEVIDATSETPALHHSSRNQPHHLTSTVHSVVSHIINSDEHLQGSPNKHLASYVVRAVKMGLDAHQIVSNAADLIAQGTKVGRSVIKAIGI